jgi:hypothetical protein
MRIRRAPLAVLVAVGMLALYVGSAQAGTGLGALYSLSSSEGFVSPHGLAVDQSNGDIYVANQGGGILEKFSITGSKAEQLWRRDLAEIEGVNQLTVDDFPGPDRGNLYVGMLTDRTVRVFSQAGEELEHHAINSRRGEGQYRAGVAVDSAGDFFVSAESTAGTDGKVLEYNGQWEGINASGERSADNEVVSGLEDANAVAVSPSGEELYIATSSGALEYTLTLGTFTNNPMFDPGPLAASDVLVAPSGDVFVDQSNEGGHNEVVEFEPNGGEVMRSSATVLASSAFGGIGVYGGSVYAADEAGDAVQVFAEGPTPEAPLTEAASEIKDTAAVLHGELNPHASAKVGWYFAYNTTGTCRYGKTAPLPYPAEVQGEEVPEQAEVTGLKASTVYTVCLVASGVYGPEYGAPLTFETAAEPALTEVSSGPASEVKDTTAVLNGELNPDGSASYYFEYCANAAPDSCQTRTNAVSVEGDSLQPVSVAVAGLLPETTYHYWLVASNGTSVVHGGEETFTTKLNAPSEVVAEASEVKATTVQLSGELNPGGSAKFFFAYCVEGTPETCASKTPVFGPLMGESQQPTGPVLLTRLTPSTTYHYWLTTANGKGTLHSAEGTFTTEPLALAVVGGESFSNVGSGSAELSAQINPRESPTNYYFEYGPTSAYGSRTSATSIGEGEGTLAAPAKVDDLAAGTEYHFRAVAVNGAGIQQGEDMVFRTLPTGTQGLPDGRVFERVTPPEDENADVYVPASFKFALALAEGIFTQRPFRAAADGNAVAYVGDPTSGGTGLGGPGLGNDYLATRSPNGGWTQTNIQPPGYFNAIYQGFSSDLSVGFVGAASGAPGESGFEEGLPALSPEAPAEGYKVLYGRDSSDGSYQPLFTKAADPKRPARESGWAEGFAPTYPLYAGSSANLSVSLFETDDALTANAVLGSSQQESNLYASAAGHLSLVNVLPDGVAEANAVFGSLSGPRRVELSHVISADGSRVFWTDLTTGDLYVRENVTQPQSPVEGGRCTVLADACTVLISEGGKFWTASADGSKVFFTDGDLYEYEVESGQTTDLTPGVEVKGVIGASEEGEYVYYVGGKRNLELWHDGSSTQIAKLSPEDGGEAGPFWIDSGDYQPGDWQTNLGHRTAEVTPDGKSMVFMSNESLPVVGYPQGYPNDELYEVYLYEAESDQLVCVSCSSSGEPPQSNEETRAARERTAAYLPVSWSNTYQPRWISEDGSRVFFDSLEPLVAQDTNGKQDVYEWEREGTGSCLEAAGCIYLLSGGTGTSASWLLDASSSGNDVFIISRTELVSGDTYDSFDLYDARVEGTQPLAPAACSGTGCQGVPPAPPIFATPSSVTFAGVGNFPAPTGPATPGKSQSKAKSLTRAQKLAKSLRACMKKRRRKLCEAQAKKRYGATSRAKGSRATRRGK